MGLPLEGLNLLVLVSVFWGLAIVSVVLRIYSRLIKRQPIVFNDWAVYIALLFTSGLAVCNIVAVALGGIGSHLPETTMPQQLMSLQIYTVVWILQALANTFVRLSFLDLLRRIFKVPAFVRAVYVVMGLSVAYAVGCFITFFALCRPFAYNWDPTIADGTCGDRYLPFLLSAVFNLALDFAIIILPLPVLWGLQMAAERKLALTAVFAIGLVVCIMTILRTIAVVNFNPPAAKMDFTYTVFYDALWSSLEPSLGVVNACLPLFPPVMKKVTDSAFFSRLRSAMSTRRSDASSRALGTSDSSQKWRKMQESGHSRTGYNMDTLPLASAGADLDSKRGGGRNAYNIEVTRDIDVQRDFARVADRL